MAEEIPSQDNGQSDKKIQHRNLWPVFGRIDTQAKASRVFWNFEQFCWLNIGCSGVFAYNAIVASHSLSAGEARPLQNLAIGIMAVALITVAASFVLRKFKSRTLSLLILSWCAGWFAPAIISFGSWSSWPFLTLIHGLVFWASVRTVEAVFKLHGKFTFKSWLSFGIGAHVSCENGDVSIKFF